MDQTSLFLAQSYQDTWEDYKFSLTRESFACWDYVILTASNEQQAEGFRAQLEARDEAGFLPKRTHFAVIPDPDGKRVGSGGATLGVIKYIAEHHGKADPYLYCRDRGLDRYRCRVRGASEGVRG